VAMVPGYARPGAKKDKWDRQGTINHLPIVTVTPEHYNRMYRILERDIPVRIAVEIKTKIGRERQWARNVIGEISGSDLKDEVVMLGAHFDTWHASPNASDNTSGTAVMLEAMRILKEVLPQPQRTILVAHWGGEEQGTNGSLAFGEDHPEVIDGLQAGFNQDNGTWRVQFFKMQDFPGAAENFNRWIAELPRDLTGHMETDLEVVPESGSSDEASFICRDAPGFRLLSHYPDYRQYTWHTDLDTYDKIVFDDLRNNATIVAMLAYMASEDPIRVSNVRRAPPAGRQWRPCGTSQRSSGN